MEGVRVCVLTVSDSCSRGEAEDTAGPQLCQLVQQDGMVVAATEILPDCLEQIRRRLVGWADSGAADIILTTGGTGFAARDVTPEATQSVLDRPAPGMVAAMLSGSLAVTPLAALARPAAGIRGSTLILNLPGSKKAARECYGFVRPALRHAADLLAGRTNPVRATHATLQGTECPHSKQAAASPQQVILDLLSSFIATLSNIV